MAIKYADWVSGNDGTGDGTFGNPYQTVNKAITGLTGGDEVRVAKSPDDTTLTGTLDFNYQSATVTGTGTLFTSELLANDGVTFLGDYILAPNGLWYGINTVDSDTSLTLGWGTTTPVNYEGTTITGQTIKKMGYIDIGDPGSGVININVSGTSDVSRILISGGWDLGTQTQTGVTSYRPGLAYLWTGIGAVINGASYHIIEKFIFSEFQDWGVGTNTNNYIAFNYVDCNNCGIIISGAYDSADHCNVNTDYNVNQPALDLSTRSNFAGTYLKLIGNATCSIDAGNSSNSRFENCTVYLGPIVTNGAINLTLKTIWQSGGIGMNLNSGGGGMENIVIDNITGPGYVAVVGIQNATLTNISVAGDTFYPFTTVSAEGYGEVYAENIDCEGVIGTYTSGDMSLTGFFNRGINIKNNGDFFFNDTGSAVLTKFYGVVNTGVTSWRREPVAKLQDYHKNSELQFLSPTNVSNVLNLSGNYIVTKFRVEASFNITELRLRVDTLGSGKTVTASLHSLPDNFPTGDPGASLGSVTHLDTEIPNNMGSDAVFTFGSPVAVSPGLYGIMISSDDTNTRSLSNNGVPGGTEKSYSSPTTSGFSVLPSTSCYYVAIADTVNTYGASQDLQIFGGGTVSKNSTGGISSGACVEMAPTVSVGVGIKQVFNFAARSGVGKTLSFYVKSINSFNGVLTGRVMFNGVEVGTSTIISLTGSYVKHSFVISSGSITVDGVLVLELVAVGTIGSVLIDKLESV